MSELIPKSQMDAVDKLYWTPGERATGVHSILREILDHIKKQPDKPEVPTDWDTLCFCVEFIGAQSVVIQDPEFSELAVQLSRWLYSVHYSNPGRLYGEPDREKEEDDAETSSDSEGSV